MKTNYYNKLKKDLKILRFAKRFPHLYKLYYASIYCLINTGIIVDTLVPFILSSFLLSIKLDNIPFIIDKVERPSYEDEIITSSGYDTTIIKNEKVNDETTLKYVSGWSKNDKNIYENIITTYDVENIDDDVLDLSYEELCNLYDVESKITQYREELGSNDYLYSDEGVVLERIHKSDIYTYMDDETRKEDIFYTILIFSLSLGATKVVSTLYRELGKEKLKEVYKRYIEEVPSMNDIEIEEMIKLKENNIDYFTKDDEHLTLRKK